MPKQKGRVSIRSLKPLDQMGLNPYEAVLLAASRARQINARKVALEERGDEDAVNELKSIKMTSFALNALLDGKIEVPDEPTEYEPIEMMEE